MSSTPSEKPCSCRKDVKSFASEDRSWLDTLPPYSCSKVEIEMSVHKRKKNREQNKGFIVLIAQALAAAQSKSDISKENIKSKVTA